MELTDDVWVKESALAGVEFNEADQLTLLETFVDNYKREYDVLPYNQLSPCKYYYNNGYLGSVDAEIYYSMIRRFKPKRIIEVGAGFSTFLAAEAISKNKLEDNNYNCELTAIDPFPNETLKQGFPGLTRLIAKRVQDVPLAFFDQLEANDFLFIDSTHSLKIGSDVQYEYLEVLPRLRKNVLVHIHDIVFPQEYPKRYVLYPNYYFWNEQYLLQAFLIYNEHFKVLWASNYMRLRHPTKITEAQSNSWLKETREIGSCSFWMQRIK